MVLTRSLQATQRKSKIEQKTLESLLMTTDATGKQVSISGRCAELDEEVPQQLGVSPAVLDAVIFCHQEEAAWPLSEPAVLKKRFDEIFAATRYTKALESLKALRKELMQQLKLEQQKLDHLRQDRDKADRLRSTGEVTERRRAEAQGQVAQLTAEMEACSGQISLLSEQLKVVSEQQAAGQRLQHELGLVRRNRQELEEGGLRVMGDVDEAELERLAGLIQARLGQADGQAEHLRQEKALVDGKATQAADELQRLRSQQAARQAEQALMAGRERDCQAALIALASLLQVNPERGMVREAHARLQNELAGELTRLRSHESATMEEIQTHLGRLSARREGLKAKQAAHDELLAREASINEQLATIADSAAALEQTRRQLGEHETALTGAKAALTAAAHDQALQTLAVKRRALEQDQERHQEDLLALSRLVEQRQQLAALKSEAERQRAHVDALWVAISDEFAQLVPGGISQTEAELEVDRLWRAKERAWKQAQVELERARAAQAAAASRLQHAMEQRTKLEGQLATARQALSQADLTPEGFVEALTNCEAELQSLRLITSGHSTYQAFLSLLRDTAACPLCERSCHGDEKAALEAKISAKLNVKLQAQQSHLEAQVARLQALRRPCEEALRLQEELGKLCISDLETAAASARLALESLQASVTGLGQEERRLQTLKRQVDEWWSARSGLCWDQVEQAENAYRQALAESGLVESDPAQLQERLQAVQTEQRQLAQQADRLTMEQRTQQAEVVRREAALRDARESLLRIQLRQTEAAHLQTELGETQERMASLKAELSVGQAELEQSEQETASLKQTRLQAMEERKREVDALRAKAEETGRLLRQVEEMSCELEAFNASRQSNLDDLIAQAVERLDDLQQASAALAEELQLQSKQASEVLVEQRTIGDNKRLRLLLCRETELEAELKRIGHQDLSADLPGQLSRAQVKLSDLMGMRAGLVGECRQLEEQAGRLRAELANDYPQVETNYRGQFVRVAAQQAACDDLERYAQALDHAIMRYHAFKMDEVNRIIREIWSSTYQGADIDTIEIRADQELVAGHRSYNYRVVMLKGDCELDMRGRSSAGQRVLASLIIRLALAETFAQHCAVLALDEPTTNLDEANIAALAEALAQIIRLRGRDGRFQLIIITHDEAFVEMLGRHECADWYWRVAKDEHQCSQIERQSFHGYEA